MGVAAVIHQPRFEVFRCFHDVLLLGRGGKTVYFGESKGALPYFQVLNHRPRDRRAVPRARVRACTCALSMESLPCGWGRVASLPSLQDLGFKCPPMTNPPDFMLDIISGDFPAEFLEVRPPTLISTRRPPQCYRGRCRNK